jgi:hypothetical protein
MSLQYSPKITTDGLVMCLDPSQNKSYPTDLPVKNGLVMWMDAADDTTFSYSSGTTVSQWRDKSGLNNHCTPLTAGPTRSSVLNSRKVLAFTTGQSIGSLAFTMETSANTVFVVSRLTGTTNARVLTAYYNNWLLGHWAGYVNQYYAEGWIAYAVNAADTTWRIYMGDWGGSSNDVADAFSNGTSIRNQTSSQAAAGPKGLGINFQGGEPSTCEAAEIIVFNRLLTTAERRLVHTYLGQKWGISNTDRSFFDLTNNNTLLLGGGNTAYMPYFDYYNKGGLKFDGSNDLATTASAITYGTNTTWEAWVNRSVSANEFNMFMGAYLPYFGLRADGSVIFSNTINSTQQTLYSAGFTSSNDTWYYLSFTTDYNGTSTTARIYINGVLNNSATFTGSQSASGYKFGIGDGRGDSTWYPFNGKVSNVKIYNRTLSAAEISQNYEAQKSKFANTIVQQGLVLNLDAGNPYSYAGSGTTWYDVSGGGYNAIIVNAPTFVSDSIKYFTCSSTQNFTISNPISSQPNLSQIWTVSAWVNIDTITGAGGRYLISGLNNGIFVEFVDSGTLLYLNSGANDYYTYGNSIEGSGWVMLTFLFRNSDGYRKIYNNLIDITTSGPNNTSTPAGNSATFTIANNMRGKIAQIMMYDRLLTVAEIAQNYNATKDRFGL